MAFFFVSMNAEKVNCLLVIQLLTCVCFGFHFSRERRRQLQGVGSALRPSFAFSRSLSLLLHLLNSTIKCIQQIYTTAHQLLLPLNFFWGIYPSSLFYSYPSTLLSEFQFSVETVSIY